MRYNSVKLFWGQVIQEMSYKEISYLELWRPFVQGAKPLEQFLVNGIMRNNSVKITMNLDQWFRCDLMIIR